MSYILNALKKSEQERQATDAPAPPGSNPELPVRLAATAATGPARARLRRPWIAAGAGAVLVVAAGAAVMLDRAKDGDEAGQVAAVEAPATTATPAPTPDPAAAAPEPEADAPPVAPAPPAETREPPLPPAEAAARAGTAAAPRLAGAAIAEPVPSPAATLQPLADPGRPETASRRLAARVTAGTAPSPSEPAAIVDTPARAALQATGQVPVPSLPLANTLPPPPARVAAKTPPAAAEPAPEPVAAVAEAAAEPPAAAPAPEPASTPVEPPAKLAARAEPAPSPVAPVAEAAAEPPAAAPAPASEPEPAPVEAPARLAARADPAWQDPSAQAPLPPVTTDGEAIRAAARFNELGWTYERDGEYGSAADAFARALAARPDYADAYFGRAWVNERLDRLDAAIEDYGWAIRLKPDFAAAYNSRGIALLYREHYTEAARHFASAFDLGDGELKRYAALWRFIAFERAGKNARAQLAADARAMGVDRWPGVLARLYLGDADTDAVLAEAETSDPITRRERLCVAYFFLGQQALLRGDQSRAKKDFSAALDTGVSAFAQYAAAERELVRLAALGE